MVAACATINLMTLITLALALYYVCTLLGAYIDTLPHWIGFLLVPAIGALMLHYLPSLLLTVIAASGIVHLVATTTRRPTQPVQKRKSNVPPLP